MNTTVTVLALSMVILSSFGGMTYAEEEDLTVTVEKYIETVSVPIEHPISNWWCVPQIGGFVPVTTCVFQGVAEDGSNPVWDHEEEKWTSEATLQIEALENYQKWVEEQTPEPTYWEEKKSQLEDRTGPTSELTREVLDKMVGALCYQGTGRAAATQDYDSWDIPTEMYLNSETGKWTQRIALNYDIDSVDLRGLYGEIQKRAQWCVGQEILENQVLSPADLTFGYLDQFDQFYHSDIAKDVPIWSQQRVSEEANRQFQPDAIDELVCNGYYSHMYKQDYGCETKFDMNFPIPRGDGFIEDSPFYQEYLDFKNGNEDPQRDKIFQQKLAEAQKRIRNHSE